MIYTCLFGKPDGMESRLFNEQGEQILSDLIQPALLLQPWFAPRDSEVLYRVRRNATARHLRTWFGIYSESLEMPDLSGATRRGYFGVGLLVENEEIDGDVFAFLSAYLSAFASNALVNRRFVRRLNEVQVTAPAFDFRRRPLLQGNVGPPPDNALRILLDGSGGRQHINKCLLAAQDATAVLCSDIFISGFPRFAQDMPPDFGRPLSLAQLKAELRDPPRAAPAPALAALPSVPSPPGAVTPYPERGNFERPLWERLGLGSSDHQGNRDMNSSPRITVTVGWRAVVALLLLSVMQCLLLYGLAQYRVADAPANLDGPSQEANQSPEIEQTRDIEAIQFHGITCERLADGSYRLKQGQNALVTLPANARERVGVTVDGGKFHALCAEEGAGGDAS